MSAQEVPGTPDASSAVARTEAVAAHLGALADRQVAAFLLARPDLSVAPSSSFTALAARASARASVEAALAGLDAPTLAVAEAVVALGTDSPGGIADHLPLPADQVAARLTRLRELVLIVGGLPVPGLVDAFGPHPFGLGPPATRPPAELPPPLVELQERAAEPNAPLSAPALAMLQALTWGPPVGTLRSDGRTRGAEELLARGWLERAGRANGSTRYLLPREVGLALREGRLTRRPLEPEPAQGLPVSPPRAVAAESARCAEEAVRLVGVLLHEWGREGAPILRAGGVGVRPLARTAEALGLEPGPAATVIELAAGAGLLGLDDAGATWMPSTRAGQWLEGSVPERWAPLAAAWAVSARTPWLVGRRGDDGVLRAVLNAEVEAGWARRLRRRVLLLMDSLPPGAVVTPAFVRAALTFARPRRPVPEGAVTAVLAEAEFLGVTGGGALSASGRVLAAHLRDQESPGDPEALSAALEEALAGDMPEAVDLLLVQSDLTAIVPGRPAPELSALLENCAVVESRGAALGVRFTPESVRGALDAGYDAATLLEALARPSPSPLPSALRVLVEDAARRHGAVRVRATSSVLRVADPAVAAGLLADARLAGLRLDEVAPGVLLCAAPSGQVLRELRATGLAPVMEDSTGRLILDPTPATPGRRAPAPTRPGGEYTVRRRSPSPRELAALVGRLRAGEEERRAAGEPAGAATDPVHALALLRQAQASRTRLRLRLAGPDGAVQERRVRVLAVEAGRVRLADIARETELTVAVHRIVSVEPA